MKITRQEATCIARKECERRDWSWVEPVIVHWGFFSYAVHTNARSRGGNAYIRIRKKDGAVLSASLANR